MKTIIIIFLCLLAIYPKAQSPECTVAKDEAVTRTIQTAYKIPVFITFNTFQFNNKNWGNLQSGNSVIPDRQQMILAIAAHLSGNKEAITKLPFSKLQSLSYKNISLNESLQFAITDAVQRNKNLKILEIEDNVTQVTDELNFNWPENCNFEALIKGVI